MFAQSTAHPLRLGTLAVVMGTAIAVSMAPPADAWSQYRGNAERTGSAAWPLGRPPPAGRPQLPISLGAAAMVDSSPVVSANGTVYLAARTDRGNLHAIGRRGLIWSSLVEGFDVRATPALLPDGRLVVVGSNAAGTLDRTGEVRRSSRERVFIVDPSSGRTTHRTDLYENAYMRSPLVDGAGTIYWSFGDLLYRLATRTSGSRLVAQRLVSATGSLTSEFELPIWLAAPPPSPFVSWLQPSPALSLACEDIFGTGARARSYRFWPGTLRGWVKQLTLQTTPAVGSAGRAYVGMASGTGATDGSLAAFSQTGGTLWRTRVSGLPAAPPALGLAPAASGRSCRRQNGSTVTTSRRDRIYLTVYDRESETGRLYAFEDEGRIRWTRRLPGRPGAPVVVQLPNDHLILVTSGSSTGPNALYAARSSGDLAWSRPLPGQALGSPAIAGGLIYVATRTGLYRFR